MKFYLRPLVVAFCVLQVLFFTPSCTSTKNIVYFNDIQDTSFISRGQLVETPIQNNDILSISISSLNVEASSIFNITNNFSNPNSSVAERNTPQYPGYLVNIDGNIQMPILGPIKAAGLSKSQLKDFITNKLLEKKLLIDPIVNVRQLNFKVTVLGEVNTPMVVTAPSEKISLLEAIGLAGDLTIYGKRQNVLLIRELNGKKQIRRIDLTSKNFFLSPYYYLQPNDVIYVEPNKAKISSASFTKQLLPTIFSGLSLIALLIYRLKP